MKLNIFLGLIFFTFNVNAESLTGDWGGARTQLQEKGVDIEFVYKGEVSQPLKRGVNKKTSYLNNLDLKLTLDADKLFGAKDTTVFIYGLGDYGSERGNSPSVNVGDQQGTSNIEAPVDDFKVYEAWVQKEFFDKKLSLLFGLHDLNSEFYVTESSGLFLNASFGVGRDLSQTGVNGPSIFPFAAPAFRVKVTEENFYLQTALFNAQAGDPNHLKGSHFRIGGSDGTLSIAELGITASGKFAVGGWSYNRTFTHLGNSSEVSNSGYYLLADHKIAEKTSAFLRYGKAANGPNEVGTCVTGGLLYDESLGFGVTAVTPSEVHKDVSDTAGNPLSTETTFELSYKYEVYPGFSVQPDYQYVTHPAMQENARGVHVGTFRIELNF